MSDEQPALSFEWGAIKWLCNQEIDPEALQTFGLVFINPGQQNPPPSRLPPGFDQIAACHPASWSTTEHQSVLASSWPMI